MFLLDIGQAPIAKHLAVTGGQPQRLQLAADAAQGVELAEASTERGKNNPLERQALIANTSRSRAALAAQTNRPSLET